MDWMWDILQIEPTQDERAVRRAYATQARIYNPEEHPQEFLRVREAYEAALAYVRERSQDPAGGSGDRMSRPVSDHGSAGETTGPRDAAEQEAEETAGPRDAAEQSAGNTTGQRGTAEQEAEETTGSRGSAERSAGETAGRSGTEEQDSRDRRDNGSGGSHGTADTGENGSGNGHRESSRGTADSSQGFRWDFTEENPFRDSEGIRQFRELYTGKRRKDRTAWSDYFHSEVFLEGYREKAFAELMLEVVRENQEAFPPGQEFLTELYITYGLQGRKTGVGISLQMEQNAIFDGIEEIREIAVSASSVPRFKGNDPALAAGFGDYRELLVLALGSWDDRDMLRLGKIIDGYLPHHISDRPIRDSRQYELSQRHPRSLKLLARFFGGRELPARVCKVPWNHLHLESATMGRDKLWYGELREAVAARVPELLEKPRANYMQLMQEISGMYFYGNDGEDSRERASLDAFFEREDVLLALQDEAFVEAQILPYWTGRNRGKYLLQKLQEYYSVHREAPFARQILEQIEQARQYQKIQEEFREDTQAPLRRGVYDLHDRPWLRYYLNVAFHLAQGLRETWILPKYLGWYMPYSPEWGKRLTDPGEGGFDADHPIGLRFGDNVLYIRFHPRHIEYLWGEEESPLVPPFPGEELAKIADDGMFWLLVPIAAAAFEAHQEIYEELIMRLSVLPLEPKTVPVIADCITGQICRFAQDNVPICTLYQEKEAEGQIRLYGCDIYESGELVLYEETEEQQLFLPGATYNAPSVESAVQMGQRILRELGEDRALSLYMETLPERIMFQNQWNVPTTIDEGQVTQEIVKELFEKYFADKANRLELIWEQRSLLFLKEKKQYACFYFDHNNQSWYALVSMPEVYAVVESDEVAYVPFGLGMLPDYLVHQNLRLIRSLLGDILGQIASLNPRPASMMWAPQIYRFETRQRYRLALRQFGGYPPEQARNQLPVRFYIPQLPFSVSYADLEGQETEEKTGEKDKALAQKVLADYLAGRLARLSLVWRCEMPDGEGGSIWRERRLCLIRDRDEHMMYYQDDRTEGMEYLVADVKEYLEAEGKKYRKTIFRGRTVPGYLVHGDLLRIRDSLDLLIPQMGLPMVHTGGFGEFSYEKNNQKNE